MLLIDNFDSFLLAGFFEFVERFFYLLRHAGKPASSGINVDCLEWRQRGESADGLRNPREIFPGVVADREAEEAEMASDVEGWQ